MRRRTFRKTALTRQVHWFKRRAAALTIVGNNAVNEQYRGYTFQLSSVVNAAEFSALYDQFKLTGVLLTMYMHRNLGNAAVVNGLRPRMYIVTDYDSSTAPSTFDELREYSNCKVWQFNDARPYKYFIRPKQLKEVYRTLTSTATAPQRPQWLSTTHLDAQHFGVRLAVENILDSDISIIIEPTYYFGLKNVK